MAVTVSILEEIADAVVAEIDAIDLSTSAATIERSIVPSFALEDLDELRIAVVARTETRTTLNRAGLRQRDIVVEIGVLYRASGETGEAENVDAFKALRVVDEIADALEAAAQTGDALRRKTGATLVGNVAKPDPAYDAEDFRLRRQITAIAVATYRIFDTIGA